MQYLKNHTCNNYARKNECEVKEDHSQYLKNHICDERDKIESLVLPPVKLGHNHKQVCPGEHGAGKNLGSNFSHLKTFSPFCNLLVRPQNRVLNVDWVISHPPQDQCLVQSTHYKHCIMVLWKKRGLITKRVFILDKVLPPSLPMASVLLRNPR